MNELMGELSKRSILEPTKPGVEKSPLKFQPTGWCMSKMSIKHILGYIGWL